MTEPERRELGQYRLDSFIGDGGMSSVYKAWDRDREHPVAIKLMHPHISRLPDFRARLILEAKTVAQLDHPSIIKIYDFGEIDGQLFIAMEFVSGGNLRLHLARLQRSARYLPVVQSLQIAAHISEALDAAHRNGVVHRDVKPGNILLKKLEKPGRPEEQPFRAILSDFGLVKILEEQPITASGMTMGTPTYMSPEQCQGQSLDGRTDLYSLGVVLYELLTNELPFEFKTLSEALAVHLRGEKPRLPSQSRPDLSSIFDGLLLRCLAKDREERFSTGAQMSAEVRRVLAAVAGGTAIIRGRSAAEGAPGNNGENIPIFEMATDAALAVSVRQVQAYQESIEPLSLHIPNDELSVQPGQQAVLNIEVFNGGDLNDRVNLTIQGIPDSWNKSTNSYREVLAGQSAIIPVIIHPPKDPAPRASRRQIRISLKSQHYPAIKVEELLFLVVEPVTSFEIGMEPRRVDIPGELQIEILNRSNVANGFNISGRDRAGIFRFIGELEGLRLEPGQRAIVEMEIEPKHRKWSGSSEKHGFDIVVSTADGVEKTIKGTARQVARLPNFVLYLAIFAMVFICAIVAFGALSGAFRTTANQPVSGIGILEGSATAGAGTAAALNMDATNNAATVLAVTAAAVGDIDGDGLSDVQEEVVGTDPNLADSDSDSLLDGEEVLTWATNPLNSDTDSDGLPDGDEVRLYGTNPSIADTDGDSMPDGEELSSGWNPLDPLDPPPSATPTTPAPSSTSTPEPSPLPSNTPTLTALPTDTRQPATTPTPDASGSQTPEGTPTAVQEPTDVPIFDLSCTNDPPEIDGSVLVAEWGNVPQVVFSAPDNQLNNVQVYLAKNGTHLFMAFIIRDATSDPATDDVLISFDTKSNGGDPDDSDRMFQVARGGAIQERAGEGDNSDGQQWNPDYVSDNWVVEFGQDDANRWIFELAIDLTSEMPELTAGSSFGIMLYTSFTQTSVTWPLSGSLNRLDSWAAIGNPECQ